MEIRYATYTDLAELKRLFNAARHFMRCNGNTVQWVNGYPSQELLKEEINKQHCFICIENNHAVATFCFIIGNDPTYNYIEDGNWINEEPYAVIHRLASDGTTSGVAKKCFDWCFAHCNNIKVDTHEANKKMQQVMTDYGFKRCGIIYVNDGTPRVAFQRFK